MNMRPDILTVEGDYFNYLTPETSVITIEAIAHGLANTCRFVGQCSEFYSVAQHSVACSYLVPQQDALAALMHDAAEAFVGDMAAPLKQLIPSFKAIEDRVERAIFARFGIDPIMPASVKTADIKMLATEQRDLMHSKGGEWHTTAGIEPRLLPVRPLRPNEAKALFLHRFQVLYYRNDKPVFPLPRCGDVVADGRSEEVWIVAWADPDNLSWMGYPNGCTPTIDCAIVKRASDFDHAKAVKQISECGDSRAIKVRSLYPNAIRDFEEIVTVAP